MATLRSVNTRFWEDPWVEDLTPSEKLLFLYLLTNKYANLAGIYEITVKRISFETGLSCETVRKGLERFAKDNKAYFVDDNYLFLPNWLKNQNLNSNMKKGVLTIFGQLPKSVLIKILGNHYQTVLKDYQTLLNTLLKYEVEIEVEEEEKEEVEQANKPANRKPKFSPPTLEDVKAYATTRGRIDLAKRFFDYYHAGDWKDGNGKAVKNWKQKFITWENSPKAEAQHKNQNQLDLTGRW